MEASKKNNFQAFSAQRLRPFPDTLLKLIHACRSATPEYAAIAHLASQDPALALRLLDIAEANRANGALRVTRLNELAERVGFDALRTLAISAAVELVFAPPRAPAAHLRRDALECALLCRAIAEAVAYAHPEEAYLAGLLHNADQLLAPPAPEVAEAPADNQFSLTEHTAPLSVEKLLRDATSAPILPDALRYFREPADRLRGAHPLVRILKLAHSSLRDGHHYAAQIAPGLLALSAEQFEQIRASSKAAALPDTATGSAHAEVFPLTESEHAAQREQLAREVRDNGFLASMRPNFSGADGLPGMLTMLRKCMHVLFGIADPMFFLLDATRTSLTGAPVPPQAALLGEITIANDPDGSLLARALAHGNMLDSFTVQAPLKVVDEQLISLARHAGIICVPLRGQDGDVGVIAAGIDAHTAPVLQQQAKLLGTFAYQAARALERVLSAPGVRSQVRMPALAPAEADVRGLLHEVSNPLTVIKNYVKVLSLRLGREDPAQGNLSLINEEIDRVTSIVRNYVEPEQSARSAVSADVNAIVFETVKLFSDSLAPTTKLQLRTNLHHEVGAVAADRDSLKQILLNLIRNAAEAMPDGGDIVIASRPRFAHNANEYVEIIVHDNGPGIPHEVMVDLFVGYQTTKGSGHAGLGLKIVATLVKRLGGIINCHTTPSRGTLFQILLPIKPALQ